jgi:hypothetical protein
MQPQCGLINSWLFLPIVLQVRVRFINASVFLSLFLSFFCLAKLRDSQIGHNNGSQESIKCTLPIHSLIPHRNEASNFYRLYSPLLWHCQRCYLAQGE